MYQGVRGEPRQELSWSFDKPPRPASTLVAAGMTGNGGSPIPRMACSDSLQWGRPRAFRYARPYRDLQDHHGLHFWCSVRFCSMRVNNSSEGTMYMRKDAGRPSERFHAAGVPSLGGGGAPSRVRFLLIPFLILGGPSPIDS